MSGAVRPVQPSQRDTRIHREVAVQQVYGQLSGSQGRPRYPEQGQVPVQQVYGQLSGSQGRPRYPEQGEVPVQQVYGQLSGSQGRPRYPEQGEVPVQQVYGQLSGSQDPRCTRQEVPVQQVYGQLSGSQGRPRYPEQGEVPVQQVYGQLSGSQGLPRYPEQGEVPVQQVYGQLSGSRGPRYPGQGEVLVQQVYGQLNGSQGPRYRLEGEVPAQQPNGNQGPRYPRQVLVQQPGGNPSRAEGPVQQMCGRGDGSGRRAQQLTGARQMVGRGNSTGSEVRARVAAADDSGAGVRSALKKDLASTRSLPMLRDRAGNQGCQSLKLERNEEEGPSKKLDARGSLWERTRSLGKIEMRRGGVDKAGQGGSDERPGVLRKLCRSNSFFAREEKADERPGKKLSSNSFSGKERPKVAKVEGRRSVLDRLSRSGSFRVKEDGEGVDGKAKSVKPSLVRSKSVNGKCETWRSLPPKEGGGGLATRLRRAGSFLRKDTPAAAAEDDRQGSLQATVFVPRTSAAAKKSSARPATVLIVYPTGLERGAPMRPLSSDFNAQPRIDSYRFSMANLEDTQDADLDAILGELSALESQYDEALAATSPPPPLPLPLPLPPGGCEVSHRRTMSDLSVCQTTVPAMAMAPRTDSPDNDSAFSDSVSLLSSESSASSGRTDRDAPPHHHRPHVHFNLDNDSGVGGGGGDVKAEKIRLALQKMKEASVKKLFIKVFSGDGSAKSLMVDETMSCGHVTRLLADKNHQRTTPSHALVEHLPDLHLERVYEDHEALVDNLMIWTRDSKNRLLFAQRPERTMLFERPEMLAGPNSMTRGDNVDEHSRNNMIEELFSGSCVPSMEGPLYVKSDSKKGWKRHHCVLRASGLYQLPKDKLKSSYKDLVCLATFDVNQVYYGVGWRKKYKAPTEHCFALKHPSLQQPAKSSSCSKHIKFLCADDPHTMHQWVLAIRMAKHGRQLLVNYRTLVAECRTMSDGGLKTMPNVRHSTISATSSSGLDTASESGSSGCDVGFECDFPSGTIKRKPPKIPLTATTRQLKEMAAGKLAERAPSLESLPPPPPEVLENFIHPEEELPPPPPPPRLAPPSTAFLQDLQRVMRRKWQVAQKCKLDSTTTPHEVLGFRDLPDSDYRETNVSNWVAEHYGGANLYENVYRPQAGTANGVQMVVAPAAAGQVQAKKRPPPPPPPRAETTQLTTTRHPHPQPC